MTRFEEQAIKRAEHMLRIMKKEDPNTPYTLEDFIIKKPKALEQAPSLQIESIEEKPGFTEDFFIGQIERFIQNEVKRLNKAKKIKLQNKISCKLYGETEGYIYQQECIDIWNWSVKDVYEPMRVWKDTLTEIPTLEEFEAELNKHKYTVVYPEEEE